MHQPTHLNSYALSVLAMVKQHIDQHPLERNRIENLTDIAGISRKVLQKNFKHYYGITISEYQLQRRLEAAAIMLEEGRLSKKQIAARCGYDSQPSFTKAFRKQFDMSPSDWQRKASTVPINEIVERD